jgi:hypothetical protein
MHDYKFSQQNLNLIYGNLYINLGINEIRQPNETYGETKPLYLKQVCSFYDRDHCAHMSV